ncbi:MAG: UPF0149 family protein [Pseudomonadota bacterium]|nr:UPF0149 family protein [Pseudomonadota bacterium]
MQDDISGWNDWDHAFTKIPELSSPSELHGLMTGLVCVAHPPSAEQWQAILAQLGFEPLSDEPLRLLTEDAEDMAQLFVDGELDYMPLLPDDEHPLSERVAALSDWCSGLLLGFGLAGGVVRADENELLADLQQISTIQFDDDDDDEDGEISYADLVEFVRFIPVSLATGREKTALAKSALLAGQSDKTAQPDDATADRSAVVEMFQPDRPS